MITPEDVFRAYFSCRARKRRTSSALHFEMDFERSCFALYDDIMEGRYEIGLSSAFVVDYPVKREVFAASFRDRIVHHLIAERSMPILEKLFIYDSYACRPGRGTSFGITRAEHFMRSVSENYTRDAYVLKLDIRSFFMSIDRGLLLERVHWLLYDKYPILDERDILFSLCEKIILHNPTKNVWIRGDRRDWIGLPKTKSLFFAPSGKGLPIGNLTSQLFGNLYLHTLDVHIKEKLHIRHYGRYVDDMLFFHPSREVLESLIPIIRGFLIDELGLVLHEDKIVLKPVMDGIEFLGAVILPYRKYVRNRIKNVIVRSIHQISHDDIHTHELLNIQMTVNSYFGYLSQFDTFRLREKFARKLSLSHRYIRAISWRNDYRCLDIITDEESVNDTIEIG